MSSSAASGATAGCGINVAPSANTARVYVNKTGIVANLTGVCARPRPWPFGRRGPPG